MLCQALLVGKLNHAVELCIIEKRWAEAFVLAEKSGPELFEETKRRFLTANNNQRLGRLLSAITLGDWRHLVEWISVEQWREALVALLTYESDPAKVAPLVERLAERMVYDHGSGLSAEAEYCLVAAANVESITKHLLSQQFTSCNNVNELGTLVEKCAILRMSLSVDNSCGEAEAEIIKKYSAFGNNENL